MIANYHTHTMRCNHAKGSEEEYIRAALEAGLKELGFSDHTPQPFKDGYYSKMRMRPGRFWSKLRWIPQWIWCAAWG